MKIIKSKKYKIIESERRDPIEEVPDPYVVNFTREEEKAKGMSTSSLFFALKDAIEASQVSVNAGKYFDQASVYRRELEKRGFSIEQQDEKLKTISSLHTSRLDAVKKTHGIWKDMPDDVFKDLIEDDRHMA